MRIRILFVSIALCMGIISNVNAQITTDEILGQINTITTAVPFLLIAPDARAGSLGDVGVASTPDANSMHWNPAKYAFIEKEVGFALSYSPWLRALVNDINLAYLTGYYKLNDQQAIAASLLYFTLGEINFRTAENIDDGTYKPYEMALDATYSRKLSEKFSGAVALRYIYSNLTLGRYVGGTSSHAGQSVATDVAMYYVNDFKLKQGQKAKVGIGLNISNIGAKISYTETTERDFIPTNMRLGTSFSIDLDNYNRISLMVDVNKLLVPTPPVLKRDEAGNYVDSDSDGEWDIERGEFSNVSVVSGIFQSFSDAPGGTKEEIREFTYGVGVEYWYDKQFALRGGYFHEHPTKGNREYFTLGAGLKYNVFGLDFAYLIPVEQRNPLENTLRFTLLFDFEAFKKGSSELNL
ncbi:type IX secretion system outer membrane channel protein PorV [candidate division KSB1 bacterium]